MAVDDQIMEDLNNLLYSGDIPNMFTVDEKLEVIESMRCLERNVRDIPDSPRLISFYFGPNSFHFLSAAQIGADANITKTVAAFSTINAKVTQMWTIPKQNPASNPLRPFTTNPKLSGRLS